MGNNVLNPQGKEFGGPSPVGTADSQDVASITIRDTVDFSIFRCHSLPKISYGKTVNWSPNDIIGRSIPIYGYMSSSSTAFDLSFGIYGPITKTDNRSPLHVKEACDWFHSLAYPDYGTTATGGQNSPLLNPPHPVLLTIGNFKTMICIVTGVHIEAGDIWDTRTLLPMNAQVSLSCQEIGITTLGQGIPPGVADIRPKTTVSGPQDQNNPTGPFAPPQPSEPPPFP